MQRVVFSIAALGVFAALAPACSLCRTFSQSYSLAHEFENAQVIVRGNLANARLTSGGGRGTTELHVQQIVKADSAFPRQKVVLLQRYLPVIEMKKPPSYVFFFRATKDGFEPYWYKEVAGPAVLDFVAELQKLKGDPAKRLLHAARHLDNADSGIADEAFLVFAKADDKLIAENAARLSPINLRKLVQDPLIEPARLSMFAYLLGACGNADDAELLRTMLKNRSPRHFKAYEGILAGYITLRPKEGWTLAQDILKSPKQDFMWRYSTLRTLRFFYNANPKENGPHVMRGLAEAIGHFDIADVAIRDLQAWKRWEHTRLILSCWDKKRHNESEIVRQSIVRYALACPEAEARAFLERARRQDRALVERMEAERK